ncbi:MAG: putative membrane protein YecN with MAPEG domain [Phenylobacterium sp.]|jgi:uncharacterized membrane protein YecN with MAPEG domain
MHLQITAIYAALCGLLMLALAYRVVTFRRSLKVGVGDNGDRAMSVAIRAHANLVEYAPITLLLLLVSEINGAPALLLHGCGAAFIAARLGHAWGFSKSLGGSSTFRTVGTLVTWIVIAVLSVFNLFSSLL